MTPKERLYTLLNNAGLEEMSLKQTVDYLLANGVVVLRETGKNDLQRSIYQTLLKLDWLSFERYWYCPHLFARYIASAIIGDAVPISDVEWENFLSQTLEEQLKNRWFIWEEAEQALKERSNDNT